MEKNRYHNTSEEKKQRLKEYQKEYREAQQSKNNNISEEKNTKKNIEKQKSLRIINKIVYVLFFSKLFLIINIRFGLTVWFTV